MIPLGRFHRKIIPLKGTINGLHYNLSPYEEIKLVRCIRGTVINYSVKIDNFSIKNEVLLDSPNKIVIIPYGYAHGYKTIMDNCEMEYFITGDYHPEAQMTIDPKMVLSI